jgi:hypothetical protein
MRKQLKPCPLCGKTLGVQIISAINGKNKKSYRAICWGEQCKHILPSDWYEKRKDAITAWDRLTTDFQK